MSTPFIITADSIPLLDEWGWWEGDYWSCNDWITWHKAMKQKYGLEKANQTFVFYWHKQTMGASALDCRSFNPEFISYAKENGFHNALYSGLLDTIIKPVSIITQTIDTTSSVATTALKIFPYLFIGLGVYYGVKFVTKAKNKIKTQK